MGIDIYMRWDGQTEDEKEAQFTGYSTIHGHVGYLREAYHGGPYATRGLVPEAFEDETGDGVRIPASTLRQRLPEVVEVVMARMSIVYNETIEGDPLQHPVIKSYIDFVQLAERKEKETGQAVVIFASW